MKLWLDHLSHAVQEAYSNNMMELAETYAVDSVSWARPTLWWHLAVRLASGRQCH